MKKYLSLLLTAVAVMLCATYAFAESETPRLVDNADIISDENEAVILSYLDDNSAELDFDFVVLTEDSIGGGDVQDFADMYYDNRGFGYGDERDGILLLIVMDTREWALSTSGMGISYFGDAELGDIESAMLDGLSDGNYAQGIYNYAQTAVYYVDYAKTYGTDFSEDGYYVYDNERYEESLPASIRERLTVSGVIGLIVALIAVSVMRSKMNTVHKKQTASDYIVRDSLNIIGASDRFITSNIARTPRVQSDSGRSGGSHHGGGSVHISSGGGSHGGSHGHF